MRKLERVLEFLRIQNSLEVLEGDKESLYVLFVASDFIYKTHKELKRPAKSQASVYRIPRELSIESAKCLMNFSSGKERIFFVK